MNLNSINYRDVIPATLRVFPELKGAYEKEAARWTEEPFGPYNLFDIIVMPHVLGLLNAKGREDELRKAFEYFENLATHSDEEISNLIGVAVCEELCSHEAALQRAVKFMGPKTKSFCDSQLRD